MKFLGCIEEMPIGAKLTGVWCEEKNRYEDLISIRPRCIEIHDDIITLTVGVNGKLRGFVEVNIKKGTMVQWEDE